jgi:hypothetical protein
MNDVSLDQLSFNQFHAHLNSTFRVRLDPSHSVELELVEAVNYSGPNQPTPSAAHRGYERFSLVFAGPEQQPLVQKMHPFEQDDLGAFPLFIVPIRQEKGLLYYEAIFNRLAKSG